MRYEFWGAYVQRSLFSKFYGVSYKKMTSPRTCLIFLRRMNFLISSFLSVHITRRANIEQAFVCTLPNEIHVYQPIKIRTKGTSTLRAGNCVAFGLFAFDCLRQRRELRFPSSTFFFFFSNNRRKLILNSIT